MNSPTSAHAVETLEDLVFGPSLTMRRVLDEVTRSAEGRSHILITGEPGTGRELVAREIHRRGSSVRGAFVKVTFAAQSPEAFEDDLFGYHTRSGTGDRQQERRAFERITRSGQLHQARDGTLFLANLAEIPSRIQARLVRLFRDDEAIVLHERVRVSLNFRVIASVEQGYEEAVREGRVRQDLHRLISSVKIDVPPLRERREDVPALATFFVEASCREYRVPLKTLEEPALQLLSALPWHGNARELQSVLQGLVQRVAASVIRLEDVLGGMQLNARPHPFAVGGTLREARVRFERDYIAAVLEQHEGRIPETARVLGIERTNLYRKLKHLRVKTVQRRARETSIG